MRGSLKDKNKRKVEQQHHDVMRLLVRRYITEQQRKADERKVTEDDVNEIKQDVSTFRFQLIDILKNNGMNTSIASNEDPTVIGRKGRAMERKLMKGFNIGRVEGIVKEVLTETKKTSNVFGKLAQAIGSKRKSAKTDWNAKVHRASMRRDQIGSSTTSLSRSQTSIRRRIQFENEQLLQSMNPSSITEYNPNVEQLSDQTKIAYAKFKMTSLQVEKIKQKKMQKLIESSDTSTDGNATILEAKESDENIQNSTKSAPVIFYENETKSKESTRDSVRGRVSDDSSKSDAKIDSKTIMPESSGNVSSRTSKSITSTTTSNSKADAKTFSVKKLQGASASVSPEVAGTASKMQKSSLKTKTSAQDQISPPASQVKTALPKSTRKSADDKPSSATSASAAVPISSAGKSQTAGQSKSGWI
ncbi:hypothetical protein FHG87_019574 [Trinorchestia longiramus]|nr:hypothetical protein FHG87_019574 [Trinorchestia longiramus]